MKTGKILTSLSLKLRGRELDFISHNALLYAYYMGTVKYGRDSLLRV